MTVNSAVILMCQSCNDGGYFIYLSLLFYYLFCTYSVMSRHVMYSTSNVLYLYYFSTCYVNTLRATFQLFSSYFVKI